MAISLKRKYEGLKLPDSIIVTTAINEGLPLVTGDKFLHKIEEVILIKTQSDGATTKK